MCQEVDIIGCKGIERGGWSAAASGELLGICGRGWGLRFGNWRRGWHRAFLGAQIGDKLIDLVVGKDLAEGRHLDATLGDLGGDLIGLELFADRVERGGAIGALEMIPVAEDAAAVTEENGAGELILFRRGGVNGQSEEDERKKRDQFH